MYAKGVDTGKTLEAMHESAPIPSTPKSTIQALAITPKISLEQVGQTRVMNGKLSNGATSQKSLVLPQRSTSLRRPSAIAQKASTSSTTNATKSVTAAPASGLWIRSEPTKTTSAASSTTAAPGSTIKTRSASRKELSLPAASALKSGDSLGKLDPKAWLPSYSLASDHGTEHRLASQLATSDGNPPKPRSERAKVGNNMPPGYRKSVSVASNLGRGNVTLLRRASVAQVAERKSSKAHRPTFSTMQQHFTPREESKRVTRSRASSVSGSQVVNHQISDQDSAHQIELLQLHLLHRSAHVVENQWLQSAETKLRHRFESLVPKHTRLRVGYTERQHRRNALALAAWVSDSTGGQLSDKIQTLSWIVMEVDGFLDPAGKYMRVVTIFEEWFNWVSEVLQSRSMMDVGARGGELRIIEGLGNPWRAEVAKMEAQLASYSTRLESLGPAHEESCLNRTLCLLESAFVSMLEEMDNVRSIESDIMFQEADWLRCAIEGLV